MGMYLEKSQNFEYMKEAGLHIIDAIDKIIQMPPNIPKDSICPYCNSEDTFPIVKNETGQIMNALERGIKMQRRDRSFAKASYSGKSGTISWFMPLHIDAPLSEDPELVMVVRRSGDFYEIKTILSYDDELKDRITALSLYSKLW